MKTEKHHNGIVRSIDGNTIDITITSDESECNGCAISSICNISDQGTVSVKTENPERYVPGQKVTVAPGRGGAWKAIIFLLAIPILLFIAGILTKELTGITDSAMGIGVLTALILYFTIIYFSRKPLHSSVHWHIRD